MPPTVWADWRIWLYFYAASEGPLPSGLSGDARLVAVTTHQGSTAFGNPSFEVLDCPDSDDAGAGESGAGATRSGPGACIFISYFLFGEGAMPGEAGVLALWKRLPPAAPTPAPPPPPPPSPPTPAPACGARARTNRNTCCGACVASCPGHCGVGDCACDLGQFYAAPDPGCSSKALSRDGEACCGECAANCPGHCASGDCSCEAGDFYQAA